MTRLKQAWLALCGKLEPEVREVVREVTVLGTPEPVTLYEVILRRYSMGLSYDIAEAWFLTCEQAHAECPNREIRAKTFWRIGETYLTGLQVTPVYVQPKPKIPKGKRK